MKKMNRCIALLLCLVLLLSMAPVVTAAETNENLSEDFNVYTLASVICPDKDYVIVSNGYALTNRVSGNTLAGTPVTLDGDNLASPVTEDMIWHFSEGVSAVCGNYTTGYFLTNATGGGYLARASSGGSSAAPLNTTTYDETNVDTKPDYCYWVLKDELHYERKALFLCNYSSNNSSSFVMKGGETFTCPSTSHANEDGTCQANLLRLFEVSYAPDCEHDFTENVVAPTCEEKGYTEHTCSVCGWTYTTSYVKPLGHSWDEETVSAEDPDFMISHCTRCGLEKTPRISPNENQILFMSDLHSGFANVNGFHNLKAILPLLKNEGFYPAVVTTGGDTVEDQLSAYNDWYKTYDALMDIVDSTYPEAARAWTTGNHEWEWSEMTDEKFQEIFGFPRVGMNYANDHFEIFQIGAQGNTSNVNKEIFWDEDIAKLDSYLASKLGSNKTIFIQTHWPLHWGDNWGSRTIKNADKMIDTINSYGDDLNIVFIWGHNHYTDAMRHNILQYGDTLYYTQTTGKEIKFTYANAGCMNNYHDYWNGDTTEHAGPGVCLSAQLSDEDITFTYNRIDDAYYIPGTGKLTHDANLVNNDGTVREHPAVVTVPLREPVCCHEFEITETAPTCTEQGFTSKVCKLCGRTVTYDYTDALDHAWDEGTVTAEPTETADGVITITCTRCGETKTARIPRIGSKVPADIDFSNPADAEKYEIVNKASSAIVANEGLSLVSTTNSSPEASGNSFKPSDLVSIPVGGSFSATLKFDFTGGGGFSFFGDTDLLGFYLADDNDNFVGIRAGNGALLNLVKKNGTVTTANAAIGANTKAGLTSAATHWFKLEKSGDNVTASWSTDGENFTQLFVFDSTGLVGKKLIIDAYNTSAWAFGAANSYILKSLNYTEIMNPTYKLGPAVVKDSTSPTGYVGKFHYFDDSGEQVYFCGDLMLSYTDEPGRNAATYSPFDYKPGMMRRGGSQFKQPMKDLGDGYWYYELPLTAGANQYWFNTETNTRMLPDPANHPQWSPASNWDTKNAYNAIYVPYDAKQNNEVLKAREIENPREGQNNGTWSYVPYKLSEAQASDYYMGVYLPYDYDAEREVPYKTIYVLHGGGQDESDWLGIGSVQNIIDNLYADGAIEDAPILIVPRNTRLGAGNLEATFAFVEANYNVSTDRMDRAICGLSMGGMMINSLLNDDKKREEPSFGYYGFFSGGNPSNALNSPYLLDSCYYVGSGLYEGNPYNQTLVDTGAPYHFTQFAGAHDFNTWCQMFTDFAKNYAFQPEAFYKKEVPFKDVNPGTPYYDVVKWAVDNGITNGFEPDLFSLDTAVTRAQIVTMLWRAAGCPAPTTKATFKDLKANEYYVDAIAWAVENGITNGIGKNKFAPDDTCTRGQIVTFLWRYMGKPAASAAAEFTDVPTDEYYTDAIAWALEASVTEGYPDGTFKPMDDCTRAQAVTFLQRAIAD